MPAFRATQQKADTVIKTIGCGIDGQPHRKTAFGNFGKARQHADQFRAQHAAARRGDNMAGAAFQKAGHHTAGKAFDMEGGAAPAVPRRNMRIKAGGGCHTGTCQKPVQLGRFPGNRRIILPMLEGAAATGGKSVAVRFPPFCRRGQDFLRQTANPLTTKR